MTERPRRTRIGVVSCYFPLFDAQMPPGFRQEREGVARGFAELLARDFDVVDAGMLASDADGDRANAVLRAARPDAVVVAPTMAAPPSYTVRALADLDVPIVVWNPVTIDRLPDGLTQAEATVNSSQVAAVMLANTFVRAGRAFATVTASPADEAGMATLARTVRGAAAASALRGASVLRVGTWIPGYLDVESSREELARLGVAEHAVTAPELNDAFAAVATDRVGPALAAITDRGWTHHPGEADAEACVWRSRSATSRPAPTRSRSRSTATPTCSAGTPRSGSRRASAPRFSPPTGFPSPVRETSDGARARGRPRLVGPLALLRVLHPGARDRPDVPRRRRRGRPRLGRP